MTEKYYAEEEYEYEKTKSNPIFLKVRQDSPHCPQTDRDGALSESHKTLGSG